MPSPNKVDVVVLDSTYPSLAHFNLAMPEYKLRYWGRYDPITGVSDLLNTLLIKCGIRVGHKVIKNLLILGHGDKRGMYIGADWLDETSFFFLYRDLAKMAFLFSRDGDARVTLGGCEVGQATHLLALLSSVWGGVLVRGMDAAQYALIPAELGSVTECISIGQTTSQCTVDGKPLAMP